MSYTKPAQTNFAANLVPGELVVRLNDMTPIVPVAVRCTGAVDAHTGNIVVDAYARVVNGDGTNYLDVNGQPIKTTFQTSMDRGGLAALGGAASLKKLMLLTVIGEDVVNGTNSLGLKWVNPPDGPSLEHANIRINIASAIDAMNNDASSLL